MLKFIAKVFGTKSEKDIKKLMPIVGEINAEYAKLSSLSDQQLREKTRAVREQINSHLASIDKDIADLHTKVDEHPDLDIHEKEDIFNQIDKLEEKRNDELEKVLMDVLPQAFAIVKDTARRFKENDFIIYKFKRSK